MATSYWKWSPAHKKYYHQEFNPNTGEWDCKWDNNAASRTQIVSYAGTPIVSPTGPSPHPRPIPHPLDPYGSRTIPVHTQSLAAGAATVTQSLAHLNINGGHTSQRSSHNRESIYPQSRSVIVAARPEASSKKGATYYLPTEPSHSIRPADRAYAYHSSQNRYDQPSAEGHGDVRDRRTSFNKDSSVSRLPAQTSHYPTTRLATNDGRNEKALLTQGSLSYASESRAGGSSQEAQASSASYSIPPSMSARNYDSFVDHRNEKLNPREYKQQHSPKKFFTLGRVFIMFHIENAGQTSDHASLGGTNFTSVAYGEMAHHQFRRFVVVEEVPIQYFSYCCPITTHGGRATTKPGVDQSVHTIVYSTEDPPEKLPGESKMLKDPLRIVLSSPDDKLDPRSRINLGRMHSIDHNVKVKKIGDVHPRSLPKLLAYRRAIRDNMN